ncbi:MAG TPA: NAD(P)/FAD-dependent oxidoreductase [Chlorobaculum sp.]|nr:NAD(P)/FAD-dependent oxidoreductase [Chlorobaculum sp.]
MDIRDLHCIVIGAGIGGLSAGALLARKGVQVTLLETQGYPGGCAGTFTRGGYRFDSGATLGCGFHEGAPMDVLGKELDLPWPVKPEPVAWQYRHGDLHIDLGRSRNEIIDRFPRSASFWKEQSMLAGLLWKLSYGGLSWPLTGPVDLARLARKAVSEIPGTARLLKFATRSAFEWLAAHGLDTDGEFVRFIDAQLLVSVQTTSRYANAVNAAIALDLPVSGSYRVEGGIGRISELLAGSIERDGGAVLYGKKVIRIDSIRREVLGVETEDGDALAADLLIADLTPDSLAILEGRTPEPAGGGVTPRWGAFTLYLGMESSLFRQEGLNHLQITAAEGELGEGGSIFVSASPADDPTRAPDGLRAVTFSTHTRPEPWFEALAKGRQDYLELKELYTRRLLGLLNEQFSESAAAIRSISAATPVTWERWTGRSRGYVGGYAQTSLFDVRSPSTGYDNLFLVGDSIFPGQSLPGVVTGARRSVELALRRYGK